MIASIKAFFRSVFRRFPVDDRSVDEQFDEYRKRAKVRNMSTILAKRDDPEDIVNDPR